VVYIGLLTRHEVHENLIHRASCIIIVTADANRNLYQAGFTKHVAMMCSVLRSTGQKKSIVVVAVSSPYDFAMDKSIGTYICTFDFTEAAMASLVRVLFGQVPTRGTLPGTLRKSKKVMKSRQQWLVEKYDRDRDGRGLNDLLQSLARASAPNHQYLQTTTHETFELMNPSIEESHFVVRNSSTHALYGFCATYFTQDTGIIGAIFADPAKRNVSVGRSLHRRALRSLTQRRGIQKIQLGTSFPTVFLGIPLDSDNKDQAQTATEPGGSGVKAWFASNGWDLQFPKRLTNLCINDLSRWSAPSGLLASVQRAGIVFDLVHGDSPNASSVLDYVAAAHANTETIELYRTALRETKTCGVVRAKLDVPDSTSVLGTVIISCPGSPLCTHVPILRPRRRDELVGGILAPLIEPVTSTQGLSPSPPLVLQGLTLMGVRQNKAHHSVRTVLSWVQDELHAPLEAMGFEVLQAFEEFTNSPANVSTFGRILPTVFLRLTPTQWAADLG
jgi:beta-N-acetylhexosaminidase